MPDRAAAENEGAPLAEPRRYLFIFVLALALLAVLVAFRTVQRLESTRVKLEFERAANDRVRAVRADLESYVNDLFAISAFFRASESVTRSEFREFTHPLHARHRGLRAFNWVPRIGNAERAPYEVREAAEVQGFRITELAKDGKLEPAANRPEYFPVEFIEPLSDVNAPAYGFDIASHPVSRAALFASRDAGSLTIAGPTQLIGDDLEQSGYLMFLPLYHADDAPGSIDARRERFAGVVVGVLQLADALRGVIEHLAPVGIGVEVADGGRVIAEYRTADPEDPSGWSDVGRPGALEYSVVDSVPFGDRELEIRCRPSADFVALHASPLPLVVLGGGGLFILALCFYFARLRHEIRERLRADMALRDSERRYRVLVEHAPEAVVVFDVDEGRFVDVNENAARLFKLSREQLLLMNPVDLSPRLQPDGRSSASTFRQLLSETLEGSTPVVPWVHRDSGGMALPCEIRLVRLPPFDRALVRGSIIDVTERRQAELHQLMMARELDHRVKNNLAEVLALAEQTGMSARSYDEFRESFAGRVRAMARTHEALAARQWRGVPLREVVDLTLGPYDRRADDRIAKRGGPVMLAPTASSALCMTLHELAANAAKYGALAVASGRVDLSWRKEEDGSVRLVWRESGGPPVEQPERAGFGTRLVHGVITHELGGTATMEFRQEGVRCEIHVPSEHVQPFEGAE
jgi:PAS domain S-box-containing protein